MKNASSFIPIGHCGIQFLQRAGECKFLLFGHHMFVYVLESFSEGRVSVRSTQYFFARLTWMVTRFGSIYTKIGTIQRRLTWPLRKDDAQIREAFHIF